MKVLESAYNNRKQASKAESFRDVAEIVAFGNCQAEGMARCGAEMLGVKSRFLHPSKVHFEPELLIDAVRDAQVVFATRQINLPQALEAAAAAGRSDLLVIPAPTIYYSGFHPDVVFPSVPEGARPDLPMTNANSAILLAAWREGLGVDDAISLFRDEVYDALGYYGFFAMANEALIQECALDGLNVAANIERWMEQGPFVYVPNHPTIEVLQDLARLQLQRHGLHDGSRIEGPLPEDRLARSMIWPVYREIAARLDVSGDYIFRPKRKLKKSAFDSLPMDLSTFVERTFDSYRRNPPDLPLFLRLSDPRLGGLRKFVKSRRSEASANPYKQLGASHWWSTAVAGPPAADVDPVAGTKFTISKADKVATAGSCFAQHLANRLSATGFNYLVTEQAPANCSNPIAESYGVFTARFGNIYTVRQLVQLAERAYGSFKPEIDNWKVPDGFIDPFRPRIESAPFPTIKALRRSRRAHFAAVRVMIESADVFVFTLGLTEGWVARGDGAVVPLAPGVVGAEGIANDYAPRNFTVAETAGDLRALVNLFQERNRRARILLTVSPVPLIATHQSNHVLEATAYSKAVLRAAAGEVADHYAHVAYFPSYEIITGSFNRGRYFAEDLRQVTEEGVDHVMRTFLRHYAGTKATTGSVDKCGQSERFRRETRAGMGMVCDEEEIAESVGEPREPIV